MRVSGLPLAAIVRAEAEATAGRYRRAREMLLAVLAQPELARHPPTHADALMWLGMAELRLGNYPVARDHLLEAHWIALAAGADETALGTAALLPDLLIEELGDREAGRQWLRTGEALLARTGLQGSNAQLNLLYGWADLATAEKATARAVAFAREAVALVEATDGPAALNTGHALAALGQALRGDGQLAASLAVYERALALTRAGGSPQAQLFARFHVATARFALGEHELARAEIRAVHDALPARDLNVEPHHRAELERWIADHGL